MTIFDMSISASILIFAVITFRFITINRLPKLTLAFLWGAVICRLLIPIKVSSPVSIFRLVDTFSNSKSSLDLMYNANTVYQNNVISDIGKINQVITESITSNLNVQPIILIWVVGMISISMFFIITHLKCKKEYQTAIPISNEFIENWKKTHCLTRSLKILQSDQISVALTYGIFHPVILLPKSTNWQNTRQVDFVLTHEYIHVKHFDALVKILLVTTLCIHWFNPLVWIMFMLVNQDIELICDETVVHVFGDNLKSFYARTLINLEEQKSNSNLLCNHFSRNTTHERIVSIMKIKKTTLASTVAAIILVTGTVSVFATTTPTTPISSSNNISIGIGSSDDTGVEKYSYDGGQSWGDQSEWKAQSNIEWWTAEDYSLWIDEQEQELQQLVLSKASGWNSTDGDFIWTQSRADRIMGLYNENLNALKDGKQVSKSVNGSQDIMIASSDTISDGEVGQTFFIVLAEDDKSPVTFGPFETETEAEASFKRYCDDEVAGGRMTSSEAAQLIKNTSIVQ